MMNQPYGTPYVTHQQNVVGRPVASQYRGYARPYQPIGTVPSYYNPQAQNFVSQPSQYHLPHYVGHLPDHDRPLHDDSVHPSQQPQFVTNPMISHIMR
jgi:hypothetical protein